MLDASDRSMHDSRFSSLGNTHAREQGRERGMEGGRGRGRDGKERQYESRGTGVHQDALSRMESHTEKKKS